ncbi:MAG: ATP-grasp domain-containing protein, partial [Propionibacteriaceae bacterium]|nr:ATP-grasp domain-containing protein [Propionibacteriaceae bacterium]
KLCPPLLLKPAWGAGSVGQAIVGTPEEMIKAWEAMCRTIQEISGEKLIEGTEQQFVVEEIIVGDTAAWFGSRSDIADYVSVEGYVQNGEYHPVAITGRFPCIGNFTEMGSFAPCPLEPEGQQSVLEVATVAVNALMLENCGTHTEVKLTSHGPVLIESAARLGGSAITEVIERVYGVDLVGLVTQVLLGSTGTETNGRSNEPRGAAAELSLIGADAKGTPWSSERIWDSSVLDSGVLKLSRGTVASHIPSLTVTDGSGIAPYRPELGITNCAGILLLKSPSVEQVVRDAKHIFNSLGDELECNEVEVKPASGW